MATAAHLFPSRVAREPLTLDAPPIADEPSTAAGATRPPARLGHQRMGAVVVSVLLVGATAVSVVPAGAPDAAATAAAIELPMTGAVGGPGGDAVPPRIVVGGAFGLDRSGIVYGQSDTTTSPNAFRQIEPLDIAAAGTAEAPAISGPFLEDGTLLKPVSVSTTVDDGSDLLRTYKVKSGDTLASVARRFKVGAPTVFWANNLKTTKLKAGWRLMIPPVDGLVVTVRPTDTLEALAAKHKVKAEAILAANKLSDPHLVMGQVLVVPGAKGAPLPKPKPKKTVTKAGSGAVASGGPSRYSGGRFVWPTGGGSISRGFRSGHQGLDIAADPGTTVRAAAGGKVLFAGWKSNGGGYQVWVSHGSGLYTTYNHMSSLSVGTGQSVGRGQRLGGVGSTGNSTGPHLHFEVWRGPIWNGGTRVNPMNYL